MVWGHGYEVAMNAWGAQGRALPQGTACTSKRERESATRIWSTLCAGERLKPFEVIWMQYADLRSAAGAVCPPRNWTRSDTIQSLQRA